MPTVDVAFHPRHVAAQIDLLFVADIGSTLGVLVEQVEPLLRFAHHAHRVAVVQLLLNRLVVLRF